MNLNKKYNKINNSFKKKCIFRIGDSQGFFSEINNMIFAMIYCLQKKIKFILYSDNANFSPTNGWEEFFLPFCQEVHGKHHKYLNKRSEPKTTKKKRILHFVIRFLKNISNTQYTYDIFDKFVYKEFMPQKIAINELGLFGNNTIEASQKIAEMLWRFNDKTKNEIDKRIAVLNLPEKYISVHIRGGDKFYKPEESNSDIYIEKIKSLTEIKDIYVYTDDYRYILEIQEKCPDWNIYTLCNEDEKGYMNASFNKLPWNKKKEGLLNLFASIEIIKESSLFIGITSSNPDLFLRLIMDKEKYHTIDEIPSFMMDEDLLKQVLADVSIKNSTHLTPK